MTRENPPERRRSESADFSHLGILYAMQIGVYEDGRLCEIFLQMHKAAGTIADVNARDISILISMALQHGVPLKRMLKSVTKDEHGQPEGLAGAVIAYLAEWQPVFASQIEITVEPDVSAKTVDPPAPLTRPVLDGQTSRQFGYTGDQCTSCNAFTMVRNGTCLKCDSCGTTTGCS